MKRLSILLIILSLLIASPLYAQVCRGVHAGVVGASGAVACATVVDQATTVSAEQNVASNTSSIYVGQFKYRPSSSSTICGVDAYIGTFGGDPSAIQYQIEIHTMTTINLNPSGFPTGTCTSTAKTVTASGWNSFSGLSCQLDASTDYALVITRTDHSYNGTDHIHLGYQSAAVYTGAGKGAWMADGTYVDADAGVDTNFKVYK